MKPTKTRVCTVTCPECHVEMYSRAHHDYRTCCCPNQTMVDGGFAGYFRCGGDRLSEVRKSFRHRFVAASRQELYDDWNYHKNKFGVIVVKKGA